MMDENEKQNEKKAYRVYCEDCEFEKIKDGEYPPDHILEFYGSRKEAISRWSAKSAAKGERDGHQADYDYTREMHHTAHMEVIE